MRKNNKKLKQNQNKHAKNQYDATVRHAASISLITDKMLGVVDTDSEMGKYLLLRLKEQEEFESDKDKYLKKHRLQSANKITDEK